MPTTCRTKHWNIENNRINNGSNRTLSKHSKNKRTTNAIGTAWKTNNNYAKSNQLNVNKSHAHNDHNIHSRVICDLRVLVSPVVVCVFLWFSFRCYSLHADVRCVRNVVLVVFVFRLFLLFIVFALPFFLFFCLFSDLSVFPFMVSVSLSFSSCYFHSK